jgi:predicted GNAT family N-acyltransferase
MSFRVEQFDSKKHDRTAFSCGKPALDQYLATQISQEVKKRVTSAFVLLEETPEKGLDPEVLGYYTLSAWTIDLSVLDRALAKKLPRYPYLPATLLGRLAINQASRGQGLGELLLIDALSRAYGATKQVASIAVVVEALDSDAVGFYQHYGFQRFHGSGGNDEMRLYLPSGECTVHGRLQIQS